MHSITPSAHGSEPVCTRACIRTEPSGGAFPGTAEACGQALCTSRQPQLGKAGRGQIWESGGEGEWVEGSSVLRMWLPDLANKNTESSVNFKFQIHNRYIFF